MSTLRWGVYGCLVVSLLGIAFEAQGKKKVFLIPARTYDPGFFSMFNSVIGALDKADRDGAKWIVVDFGTHGLYYEPTHGPNWWSYYFEPISQELPKKFVTETFSDRDLYFLSEYAQLKMSHERAHELIHKYIRVKSHILQRVDTFFHLFLSGYFVIGVHYRGTDKGGEVPLVDFRKVLCVIQEPLKKVKHKQVRIFLATDDLRCVQYLKSALGDKLVFINTIRLNGSMGVHVSPEGSRYQKGEDALVDCLLLSRCNLLIKTGSNLSDCSRQFNPKLPVIHLSRTPGDIHS